MDMGAFTLAAGARRLEALGPRAMRAALQFLRVMAREWRASGTYAQMTSGDSLPYDEVSGWFTPGRNAVTRALG